MERDESALSRRRRPILLVDSRRGDRAALVAAAERAGLLARTVPNEHRARIHLARGDERVDLLVLPPCLDETPPAALACEARRLRPTLPILFVAPQPSDVEGLEQELQAYGLSGPRTRMGVACGSGEPLDRAMRELLEAAAEAQEVAPPVSPGEAA